MLSITNTCGSKTLKSNIYFSCFIRCSLRALTNTVKTKVCFSFQNSFCSFLKVQWATLLKWHKLYGSKKPSTCACWRAHILEHTDLLNFTKENIKSSRSIANAYFHISNREQLVSKGNLQAQKISDNYCTLFLAEKEKANFSVWTYHSYRNKKHF